VLIKIGIAILILAIFGPLIGKILIWGRDIVWGLIFGFFSLPGTVIVIILGVFLVLKIIRWIIRR
jgi:hypothetical protein